MHIWGTRSYFILFLLKFIRINRNVLEFSVMLKQNVLSVNFYGCNSTECQQS